MLWLSAIVLHNIIYSYTCFILLLMLQSLQKLSTMSPPCLFCNYILHWVIPRCSLPLISENGEEIYLRSKILCWQIKGHVLRVHSVEEFSGDNGCITPWANLKEERVKRNLSEGEKVLSLLLKSKKDFFFSEEEQDCVLAYSM